MRTQNNLNKYADYVQLCLDNGVPVKSFDQWWKDLHQPTQYKIRREVPGGFLLFEINASSPAAAEVEADRLLFAWQSARKPEETEAEALDKIVKKIARDRKRQNQEESMEDLILKSAKRLAAKMKKH